MEQEGGRGGAGSVWTGRTWAVGRLDPVGQLEFRMRRQDRSFSGPPPTASGPDTPERQIQSDLVKAHVNACAVYL